MKKDKIENAEVIVKLNGIVIEGITIEQAKEKCKDFDPINQENVFKEEQEEIWEKTVKHSDEYDDISVLLDLEELLRYLQEIHTKFGNMPVVWFHGSTRTFSRPALTDIDVVRKYFYISSNAKNQFMNIIDGKALSFYSSK